MRLRWLLGALVLSILLLVLHLLGLEHFWYWAYWWFDIPMHILGGAAGGALLVGLSPTFRPRSYLAIMAAIAIGWEAMEYASGITRYAPNYLFDTFHDILDDTLGAVLVYVGARFTIWR